jgi:hypothetical protein
VAHGLGEATGARLALHEAEAIAAEIGLGPDSPVGVEIARVRALLEDENRPR